MKLCWMFALLLALTVGARGNPQGLGEPSELKDESEPSELDNEEDGELPDFTIINMKGEPLPYTVVGDGSDLVYSNEMSSNHQARSLYDYVPQFGKNAITAVRHKLPTLPVTECTKKDWSYTCCAVFTSPNRSKKCFKMEVDRKRLTLKGELIIDEERLAGWQWEVGRVCRGIPLTISRTCVQVYFLDWDIEKKEVNVCVLISWLSVVNIDYGCFHFDIENGFRKIKLEKSKTTGLIKVSFVNGKAQVNLWKPKGVQETVSNMASMVTGQTLLLGDWSDSDKPKKRAP